MRLALLAAVCLSIVGLAVAAESQAAMVKMPTNIPAQGLGPALKELAKDRGIQMVFRSEVVGSARTQGATGNFTTPEALTELLKGTNLSYSYLDENTVTIVPLAAPQAAAAAGSDQTNQNNTQDQGGNGKKSSQDFRVAQVAQTNAGPQVAEDQVTAKKQEPLEEIVVTGTHISGATPASPVISIDRQSIDQSGYADVGEVLRSLPQNFSGGQNPGVLGAAGANNTTSTTASTSANLRGLGQDSTLTLIDGHRLAYDGSTNGVDLSMIPLAAVQRIEVLTDGASAVYGSDAVAGVVNVILKQGYDGIETAARIGNTTGGGADQRQYSVLGGHGWDGGNALLSYEYSTTTPLYAFQRSFTSSTPPPESLYPQLNRNSVFAAVHQDLSDIVKVYAEGLYTARTSEFVSTTLGSTTYDDASVRQGGIASGINLVLPQDWTASLDGTFSRDRDETQAPQYNGATFDSSNTSNVRNDLWSLEAHGTGPLFRLPSGPVSVAFGGGLRSEKFQLTDSDNPLDSVDASRHVGYGYGEINIPVVEPSSTRLGLERLELNGASRFEHYNDFGSKTTSKVGLVYVPEADVKVRATWSQSFRAPELFRVDGPSQLYLIPPALTQGFYGGVAGTNALVRFGSNPNLVPETATSRTIGIDFAPLWRPTLKVSATYYDVDYANRLIQPIASFAGVLTNPAYSDFVISNPTAAQQQALISTAGIFNTFGQTYNPALVSAIVRDDFQNATSQKIHGFDTTGQDSWELGGVGRLTLGGNASWLSIRQKLISTAPETDVAGTVFNPPTFKARAFVSWQTGLWSFTTTGNYVRGEQDISTTPFTPVASWTTFDAQVAYAIPAEKRSRLLSGWQFSLSALNIFNRNPPYVNGNDVSATPGFNYDSTNASPLGRFIVGYVSKKW